ncbi:Choline-sulfatase [Pirellulimonas nuda]|uniref:Choline-sulfatase n=1 Tax=Pirellulimonas nuda TaxID=2528009 RepID=A0A518D7R3_9BACT|nr:sulfatase [Pirellulimonas nuda]QDU87517.1 Choline-sulfatase [Pirellulimonas nuda]
MASRTLLFVLLLLAASAASAATHPNVLMIAIDDLNDWVGCMGGHPQAKTPNIDRLAARGVLFENAHAAAPLCNPSRTALLTGLRPSTTGVYCNNGWFRDHPDYVDWVTLPQYFAGQGYAAWGGGKVFHQPSGRMSDRQSWDKQYSNAVGAPNPPEQRRFQHGMRGKFTTSAFFNNALDWGPIDQPKEQTGDWQTAETAAKLLSQEHDRPFFLACGIYRPHLPWYAPAEFFDAHDLAGVTLPPYLETDLDDVPAMGRRLARLDFPVIKASGHWRDAVHAYLACATFADACVGHVLDALEAGPNADDTIVVLWGDHGWHLGEKDHWSKFALWDQTSRTPLVVYAPNVSEAGGRCASAVSLIDIYPTLLELTGLPPRDDLDGRSLAPLVRDPGSDWPYPALVTHWKDNHAVQDDRYRYIHYRDGGEELYDHQTDPNEWKNLASDPAYARVKARLAQSLPKQNAEHFQPEPPENM